VQIRTPECRAYPYAQAAGVRKAPIERNRSGWGTGGAAGSWGIERGVGLKENDGSIDTIEVGIDLETVRERQLLFAGGLLPILLGELDGALKSP
jgi:hypothetical protein